MGGAELGPRDSTHEPDWADKVSRRADLSDEALSQRFDRVTGLVDQHGHLATDYVHKPDGRWSDERAALHREIVEDFYARHAHVPNERRGLMLGGLGGAGKTTTLRSTPEIDISQYMSLNPDDFKEELVNRGLTPTIPGHDLTPMETSTLFHAESAHLAEMLAERAYADGKNVVWDVTMGSAEPAKRRVAAMRDHGYRDIDGLFVDIPVSMSIERMRARYRQGIRDWYDGKGPGGRPVPEYLIRAADRGDGTSENWHAFQGMREEFNRWWIFDNAGAKPRLIQRSDGRRPRRR